MRWLMFAVLGGCAVQHPGGLGELELDPPAGELGDDADLEVIETLETGPDVPADAGAQCGAACCPDGPEGDRLARLCEDGFTAQAWGVLCAHCPDCGPMPEGDCWAAVCAGWCL